MKIVDKLISLLKLDMDKKPKIDLEKLKKSKEQKAKAMSDGQKINKDGKN